MPSSSRIVEQKHGQLRDSIRRGVGHDFTDAQQQYITNMDYKYREKRRHVARMEKKERDKKRVKFSNTYCGVKHDEGKRLQYQMGLDVLEVGLLYKPTVIAKYPQEIQDKAKVGEVCKRGSTAKDKLLLVKRTAIALERKERARKKFKTLDQYKQSLVNTSVDNDKVWESVDDATKEKREDLEKLSKISFWRGVPAGQIKNEVEKVLPKLLKADYCSMNKKNLIEVIKNHLNTVASAVNNNDHSEIVGWSAMNKYTRIELFIKSDNYEYLQGTKTQHKKNSMQ